MAIRAERLRREFGDMVAVDDVSFEVPQGQIFGFLGPNGSGKTTTIRMLLGLLPPTRGTAYLLGHDARRLPQAVVRQIGYMSQKFSLYTDLRVEENLRFFGRSYGLTNAELRARMAFVMDLAGLKGHETTRTGDLSGGWAQRLALGAAIMHRPRVVFLDEPTAGVDPVSRRAFWDLLYRLADEGTTVFVTTHYMDEAERCERVGFIYFGRLIAIDAPHAIVARTVPGEVVAFEPPDPPRAMRLISSAIDAGTVKASAVSLFGAAVHVITTETPAVADYVKTSLPAQGVPVEHVHFAQPSLEDAFIALVRREENGINRYS